jgi:hypothetical protein
MIRLAHSLSVSHSLLAAFNTIPPTIQPYVPAIEVVDISVSATKAPRDGSGSLEVMLIVNSQRGVEIENLRNGSNLKPQPQDARYIEVYKGVRHYGQSKLE